MADPLSITGTAVGVISLGIQVTQTLFNFYNSYKDQDSDLLRTSEKLDGLLDILQCLKTTLSDRKFQADEGSLVESIETSIKSCDDLIQELQVECLEFKKTSPKGMMAVVKVAGRRATYPFRRSTLQKLDEAIGEIRANLSSALDVLQLKDNKRVQDDIYEMKALLDLVRGSQISSNLRDWLNAPDATINHNAACEKKHPGTGMWLVKSAQFSKWLTEEKSIMWVNGFAGSGKSVLCSTAIQYVLRHRRSDPNIGIAFFYFTFNDKSKQDESAMLRALLLQLSSQLQDGHTDLTRLCDSYSPGIPPSPVLLDHLRRLIQRFYHVYIVLDALDESPPNGPREHVLDALEIIRNWGVKCLHLFVTSRDELDIRESLDLSFAHQVGMRNNDIDKDIGDFISGRLNTNQRLRKFSPFHTMIQESLAARAKGMFRWVDCQLEALRSCPASQHHLEHMLNSLPVSLDETYERMLCAINHYLVEDARRILTLLCFASRPLAVQELIDGVAVEFNNSTGLNRKRRLQDSNGIRDICGAFIDIGLDVDHTIETINEEGADENKLTPTVRIAHFSIQEYLESERIRHQKAAIFSLSSATAHAEIAQLCLIYLLEPGLSRSKLDLSVCAEYPLAHFAAMYWYYHYEKTAKNAPGLNDCILRLFRHERSFTTWVMLHDMDQPRKTAINFSRTPDDNESPVYYASLLGLEHILVALINVEQAQSLTVLDPSLASTSKVSDPINAQGGFFGNALQAASAKGYKNIGQTLLDKGADVNAQGGGYGNALQAASTKGHEKMVQILLDKGADVNAQSGHFGSALQAASFGGHDKILQILFDRGADVNAQGGFYGSALQAASNNGHEITVQMLLDKGADVNAQGGEFGNALQAASFDGHEKIGQMLLEAGADINAQDEDGYSALSKAVRFGHEKSMRILLDQGANLDEKVWQQASYAINKRLMQQLREHDSALRQVSPALEGA